MTDFVPNHPVPDGFRVEESLNGPGERWYLSGTPGSGGALVRLVLTEEERFIHYIDERDGSATWSARFDGSSPAFLFRKLADMAAAEARKVVR